MPPPKKRQTISKTSHLRNTNEPVILANRYKLIRKLGSGSFGTVFLVSDLKHDAEQKVLKEISIGEVSPDETISAVNEARLLAKLEHPGIVKFHDSFIDGEFFCIITEYCEGGDLDMKLHSWKKNGKDIDVSLVITWFIQILLAVQYMHQRRVLHRDLKTRNIFLKNNMVKIGDFGISRLLMGTTDIATTFTGTPYFMAPEILKHEGYNSKSDIWSTGVILYEMCTLKRAFQGQSLMSVMFKIVEGTAPPLPNHFGKELQDIYQRMLCKDPAWRISASEILTNPFIMQHLKKLKVQFFNNYTQDRSIARREAVEIAKVLTKPKKKKNVLSSEKVLPQTRPKTPKEMLQLRKQQKADEEAERLKKITVSSYEETRRKCSRLKERQNKVFLPFLDDNKDADEKEISPTFDTDSSVSILHLVENNLHENNSDHLSPSNDDVLSNARKYTHCFGEDTTICVNGAECEAENDERVRIYTHCFGEDADSDDDDDDDDGVVNDSVFDDNTPSNDLTQVSAIPEDATLADTFYSSYDDFEEVSTESDGERDETNDDYCALVNCMEKALDLSMGKADSTFGDSTSSLLNSTSMRQQKIDTLKRDCIRLLGEDGFRRAYKYLKKIRFESSYAVSEDAIMAHLKKLVGSSRDCFLVDQLLFLEKQNQISQSCFEAI